MPSHRILRYSDDEDTSYKIRRTATKLLAAGVGTRPELLVTLYKEVSPVLISRFGDREETVKLEIWATYKLLLDQTGVYGGTFQSKDHEATIGGKRKRDQGMDVEETAISLLRSQVPALAKALLAQLQSTKTQPSTLQAGFVLLNTLLTVLPGCLSSQSAQIIATSKNVLSQSSRTANGSLHVTCMSFLALYFSSHAPPAFIAGLDTITPVIITFLPERHPRLASEAFRVFSALLNAMQPVKGYEWVDLTYNEAVQRLANHDTDSEVRTRAEECIGDLWVNATDVMKTKDRKEWDAMCRTTGKPDGAVKVVTRVAKEVEIGDDWVNGCVEWIVSLLRKVGRLGKSDAFLCLDTLLRR